MKRIALLALLFLFAALPGAYAGWETQTVGANGYDVVAYQVGGKALRGSTSYFAMHNDTAYLFASETNKDAFAADPERYLPAYGGFCAYGMSNGYKVPVDPEAFTIVGGRLYLNFNADVMAEWRKNTPELISRADGNWTKIKDAKP
jgi:YHS domain-containing protein